MLLIVPDRKIKKRLNSTNTDLAHVEFKYLHGPQQIGTHGANQPM